MPGRNIPLVTDEIYHVFNRGVARQPVFNNKRNYNRFLTIINYYQNSTPPLRLSKFLLLSSVEERKKFFAQSGKQKNLIVDLIAFCLMPNHFHLLIRQAKDKGISFFISQITNSYTRYFNVKNNRVGPLFQGKFKAIRIEDDEQLLQATRYIHLNPYTGYVVKKIEDLTTYAYSSLADYLNLRDSQQINKENVLANFKTLKSFKKFSLDQADYQRKLQNIKHLILEY